MSAFLFDIFRLSLSSFPSGYHTLKNPFLSSNYLEDLQVQENFLTPQNSNMSQDKYSLYGNIDE